MISFENAPAPCLDCRYHAVNHILQAQCNKIGRQANPEHHNASDILLQQVQDAGECKYHQPVEEQG